MTADSIPPSIRAELDVTPAWWDEQFRALVRKQIPRDAASHAGHDVDRDEYMLRSSNGEMIYYATRSWCATCGVEITDVT